MKAVVLRETGGPERLELVDTPDPEPRDGQVLVRVRAAGVNFLDVLTRQGRYPQAPQLPAILGGEVAGRLEVQTRWHDLLPEPPLVRLLRRDRFARHVQQQRPPVADQARQPLCPTASRD